MAETFLDPHFWLALGCALGWEQAVRTVHVVEKQQTYDCHAKQGSIGSPTGTTSLITLRKGKPLKPSLRGAVKVFLLLFRLISPGCAGVVRCGG